MRVQTNHSIVICYPLNTFCSHSQGVLEAPIRIIRSSANKFLTNFGKSFFSLLGSDLSVLATFLTNVLSAASMYTTVGCISRPTFMTKCSNIFSPDFPGYLPTILAAVRSMSVAFSSVQIACNNIVFPLPAGPHNSTDLI